MLKAAVAGAASLAGLANADFHALSSLELFTSNLNKLTNLV